MNTSDNDYFFKTILKVRLLLKLLFVMEHHHHPDIVYLNIGGSLYSTTRHTLTTEGASMLGIMFSSTCPFERSTDSNGNIFIDRDGPSFRHILNYLRNGNVFIDMKNTEKVNLLRQEARFYGLLGLCAKLGVEDVHIKGDAVCNFCLGVFDSSNPYGCETLVKVHPGVWKICDTCRHINTCSERSCKECNVACMCGYTCCGAFRKTNTGCTTKKETINHSK